MSKYSTLKDFLEKKTINKDFSSYSLDYIKNKTEGDIINCFTKFNRQISDIYGDQTVSFKKIKEGQGRKHFILQYQGKDIGIFCYKSELQKEETEIQSHNGYIELKSVFLFDHFWEWHIRSLLKYWIAELEKSFGNTPDGIFVTVSKEKAKPSLEMFKKIGFLEIKEEKDKYQKGDTKVLLYYSLSSLP